ncbi:13189_t:CDS:2 [Entrophospora sp. SA101]|nr:14316_t:CDS:2 [Entrophospora sp. SA101]CAJ0750233.1 13189_t:CDS:2 [Entrophospora sp. SA101]CAJ0858874.1 3242_t:CDS:2 [Entrophospora sp. SA101]
MAQMHSYYVANAIDEIKYAYQGLTDSELETMIQRNVSFDLKEQLAAAQINQNPLMFDQLIDVNDQEFQRALEIEVSVLIPATEIVEHGDQEFDIQSIVEIAMLRRLTD